MNADASTLEPLIHIGYHKTGTTWLQRRIFSSSDLGFTQVWPPEIVERTFVSINPFSFSTATALELLDPFLREAVARDNVLVVSHERLSGQPLQGGMDAHELAERLLATFPRGRVLIVIRNQYEMILSIYKQITTRGLNRDTFEQFLTYRVSQGRLSPVLEFLEFHHLIGFYQAAFGRDRVLVLPYEGLRDPLAFVGEVAKFVGLSAPSAVPESRENVALPTAAVAMLRYFNILLRTLGAERLLTGPRADPKIVNARLAAIQKVGRLAPRGASKRIETRWRDRTHQMLGDRFAASNAKTAEMTGLDVRSYGYLV